MDELKDKVAIVTGASRGIGAETARLFAERGAKVVLTARTEDAIDALAEVIRTSGGEAVAVAGDVTRYGDVEAVVATATERYGRLDVMVNNAGAIEPIARLADSDPAGWDAAFDVNAKGVYHGLRAALPVMLAQGGGVVVNISSGAAVNALEGWSHYCAGKAAALMLTRSAHVEYAEAGVRVVGLSPGTVATDMQVAIKASGMNRVSELDWSDHIPPEWAARAVAWLATDDASEFDGGDVSLRDEAIRRRIGLTG